MKSNASCSFCEDGTKLGASSSTCEVCGRGLTANNPLFDGSEEAIAASMDEAFNEIVREPSTISLTQSENEAWWYVVNGRRVGPVSRSELYQAVNEQSEPNNTLIWNEGFANWRRFGEVPELQGQDSSEPHEAMHDSDGSEIQSDAQDQIDDLEGLADAEASLAESVADIEEDVLSPEGDPLDDWSPSAAHKLRDLAPSESVRIEPEGWDDEHDDVGLPPSVDTAEFTRDEIFTRVQEKSGPSLGLVLFVVLLLSSGAYLIGLQFWESDVVESKTTSKEQTLPRTTPTADMTQTNQSETAATTALPPTSIQSTVPAPSPINPETDKKSKKPRKKKSKPKPARKLPDSVSDALLESLLKKNSASLAPCIEGAVAAKQLPAGRHVMTLAYDILPSGRVGSASLIGPGYLLGGALNRCVESTIAMWRFPKTAKGREVRGQELAFRARAP